MRTSSLSDLASASKPGYSDCLAHFVIDAVAALKLDQCSINHRGTGDARFPPERMPGVLVYSYATGLFSSRRIEHATWQNVAVRYICANTHPDHDTICAFRRKSGPLIQETFVKILLLAREVKLLKVGTAAMAEREARLQRSV